MGIEEEIFEEFFEKLEEVPVDVVVELKRLFASEKSITKENILEAIGKGVNNGD